MGSILPSLLVMPKSLIFNWESEIARFAPWLSTIPIMVSTGILMRHAEANVVLTTYGMMRNDIDTFRGRTWEYVILDESQNIKNMESQTAKAA
ncbi:SNF2-related protein [Muribaculum intestinale]|uniref:SNF2-related protein n=1 Tax=Muribaculum intestinale TaxID=1796646 RepID=UPI003F664711